MTDSKKTIPVIDGTLQKRPCKDETIPTLIDIQEQIDAFAKVSSTLHEYELLDKTIQFELSQVQQKFQEWKRQVITFLLYKSHSQRDRKKCRIQD